MPTRRQPYRPLIAGLAAREDWYFVGRRPGQRRWPADLTGFSLAGIVIYGIGGIAKTTLAAEVTIWVLGRERGRVLISLTGTLTLESLPGAVISAIRRGQQLLRVVTGHRARSSVAAGHAAPIGSAWLPSAWHRGPCPCGHYALPGDAAVNHAAYYRHVAAP